MRWVNPLVVVSCMRTLGDYGQCLRVKQAQRILGGPAAYLRTPSPGGVYDTAMA